MLNTNPRSHPITVRQSTDSSRPAEYEDIMELVDFVDPDILEADPADAERRLRCTISGGYTFIGNMRASEASVDPA